MPADDVQVALTALAEDGLVGETRTHWVLTRNGWGIGACRRPLLAISTRRLTRAPAKPARLCCSSRVTDWAS